MGGSKGLSPPRLAPGPPGVPQAGCDPPRRDVGPQGCGGIMWGECAPPQAPPNLRGGDVQGRGGPGDMCPFRGPPPKRGLPLIRGGGGKARKSCWRGQAGLGSPSSRGSGLGGPHPGGLWGAGWSPPEQGAELGPWCTDGIPPMLQPQYGGAGRGCRDSPTPPAPILTARVRSGAARAVAASGAARDRHGGGGPGGAPGGAPGRPR